MAEPDQIGRYPVMRELGRGGMGHVYEARDPALDRQLALKLLPEAVAGDVERLCRFEREARALAALNHPNIVTIYTVEEDDGVPFLTMELVRGEVIGPSDAGYDEARRMWNARFDRRPGAVARCIDAADVAAAVRIAADAGLLVSVRSGGHDYAGHSVCDDGLVIDVSALDGVELDVPGRRARVGPGTAWGLVDQRTQTHGLATTGCTVSTVGAAGFVLGGGTGYLARKHGLGVDNLLAAEVVTAEGELLTASEDEHPDLFWGLRGGGGNLQRRLPRADGRGHRAGRSGRLTW